MLNPEDHLCLVTFDDKASVAFDVTAMDTTGKDAAIKVLEGLRPGACTNIWDALKVSIDKVKASPVCKTTNNFILLFTDGEPNENPPKGIIPTLQEYVGAMSNPHELFNIHTFGYGYSLQSDLLLDISTIGSGIFNYIPDCTMIGTTFVNFLGNALATAVKNAKLEITPPKLDTFESIGFDMPNNEIITGAIEFGQSRDYIFKFISCSVRN